MYKGISGPNFKLRYANHKKYFNNMKYHNESELSKEVYKIKTKGGDYNIKWKNIKQCPTYNPSNKKCALCINEKLEILDQKF